ncbi:hypothetical protein [Streptomyces sp. SM13]|uniref:hypothetical protein n=1 Tax=Streptomyces sp. SM13 TaxID=1983803 RepID=UPI000CD5B82A|nr:hypothetical protein [Streptomyces sp. SM13]
MPTERSGRTAPWAKALGAVLLALLALLTASYVIDDRREDERERTAFEATRTDARRFTERVAERAPAGSMAWADVREMLDSSAGKGNARLFAVVPIADGTRVVVQFSRLYERSLPLFGPADVRTRRCFTIHFGAGEESARITAHDAGDSCREVAEQAR